MNKIIPFSKEITFLNDIYEIKSISLEHNYDVSNNEIKGEFIISGDYTKNLIDDKEDFIYNIPFNASFDEDYNLDNVKVDIDDFNYKIIDTNKLKVNINLLVDNLTKKEVKEEKNEERDSLFDDNLIEIASLSENPKEVTSIFDNFDDKDDKYVTYYVHIYRENDDISKIIEEYKITKEELSNYNDLDKLTIGSKIIIPSNDKL